MTREKAREIAQAAHVAAVPFDVVERICEAQSLPYSLDEEYGSESVFAVNRHNGHVIGAVRVDGTFDASCGLAGIHYTCLA